MEQNQQPQPPVFNQPPQPAQPAGPQFQPRVTVKPMMNPVESVVTCIKKYFNFKGRARRSEFWWFALSIVLLYFLSTFLGFVVPAVSLVISICVILLFIPNVAALTRRLHDANHSGWWVASLLICLVGYMASYAYLLGPNIDSFTNTADPFALAVDTVISYSRYNHGLLFVWCLHPFHHHPYLRIAGQQMGREQVRSLSQVQLTPIGLS